MEEIHRLGRSGPLALALLLAAAPAALGQLTVGGNFTLREDDFDPTSFGPDNRFGSALAICDFDGDGFEDLAIGSPRADVLVVISEAGVVHVAYGGAGGLTLAGHQTLTQPPAGPDPPEAFDRFGWSLAAADFDGDGFCDLAVGAPFEQIGALVNAGSVHVFAGSAGGLESSSQAWNQDSPGVQESAEALDFFGGALAAADFDGDGFADLAIGAPGENGDGGVLHVLFGTGSGLSAARDDLIFQGDPEGTSGSQEGFDSFGGALATGRFDGGPRVDLAVAAYGESFGGAMFTGQVHVFYAGADGFESRNEVRLTQGDLGETPEDDDLFGLRLAAGDFDGDGLDDLAITSREGGIGPGGGAAPQAGSVAVLLATPLGLTATGAQIWTQDSPGMQDDLEADDHFGDGLTAGDFDGDGRADLAIGVPGEDFENGGHTDNGALHTLYGALGGLSSQNQQYHGQSGWNVGALEDGDQFGSVLAAGDFEAGGHAALVVGIPLEGVDGNPLAGLVAVITGNSALIFADGFESGDTSQWSSSVP